MNTTSTTANLTYDQAWKLASLAVRDCHEAETLYADSDNESDLRVLKDARALESKMLSVLGRFVADPARFKRMILENWKPGLG